MEDAIENIIIRSEDDAWEILKKTLSNGLSGSEQIKFEGWPVFNLTIEGQDFNGSVPTRIMPPILDLQKEIYRIYAKAKYNSEDSRNLTADERELLELVVIIKPGSTEFITKLFKVLNEIIANSKMDGKQVLILLISVSTLITASIMWKDWLATKEKEHGLDTTVKVSEQETERLKLVVDAFAKMPELKNNSDAIESFKSNLSKRLKPEDKIKINNEPIINGERAMEIVPMPKELSTEVRLDGEYIINEVKFPTKFGGKYRFSVTRITDEKTFLVDATPSVLSTDEIDMLKNDAFNVKTVSMRINAKERRGNIIDAKIVSIELPDS